MTRKQYIIEQTKYRQEISGNLCAYCGKPAAGRAHKIPQRLEKKYGWLVIDHWLNFQLTCHKCNSKAQINTNDKQHEKTVCKNIMTDIVLGLKSE